MMDQEESEERRRFRRQLKELKNLPTLPGIVAKLTRMAENPDTTTDQMGRVIAQDHILSAKLLKLVNSAFYGFPQRISSLSSAIILLGFNVIKSLIISASIFELMEQHDVELWQHSLGCAVVANELARRLQVSDPEEVSTAALLHDLGKVAMKLELPGPYQEIGAMVRQRHIPRYQAELECLGLQHAEAGGWLARFWMFPDRLVEPILLHHAPEEAKINPQACAIVHFGDILVRGLGYGHGDDVWVPPLSKKAWDILRLSREDLDDLLAVVEEKLWDVKGFSLEIQAGMEGRPAGGPANV
ncbi:MAG: HDOD domain-containing protein [Thermodesulfobacteriota bacterium]